MLSLTGRRGRGKSSVAGSYARLGLWKCFEVRVWMHRSEDVVFRVEGLGPAMISFMVHGDF